jgi:pilin isopeptide linkage protein
LFDQNGGELARATNDAGGNIAFPTVAFGRAGVFGCTVRELNPSGCGWVMDPNSYPVTVAVTDDGTGRLEARVDYPEGIPCFINRYCPPGCCR